MAPSLHGIKREESKQAFRKSALSEKRDCEEMIDLSSQSLFYRMFLFSSSSVSMKLEAKCFINQSTSSI